MSSEIPYSPIQPPSDHVKPGIKDFPPVVERVSQQVDPFADVLELEIPRVTYQGNDRCNLRCPGCYANEWLLKDGDHRVANSSSLVELDLFDEHMDALGPDLTELYALGAELTAAPDHSRELMKRAANRGLAIMAITNGARRPEVVDSTLESGLESGEIYKLNISLDSTNSEVNDQLRGKKGASEATLETIRRYAEKDYPIRVQMTVWPLNYATIMDSVKELYDNYGVRGFSFHCGSLEGVQGRNAELEKVGGSCLEPLAWRSLTDRLLEFNESHYEDIKFFYVPYIYFTEQELSDYVIGDDDLMQEYIEHNAEVEKGNPQP
jgi:MoaA/NifB/PqqE/SkfB family radical SAM enzyme